VSNPHYVHTFDLDRGLFAQHVRPAVLPDLSEAKILTPGKCATIQIGEGIAHIGGHSRCAVNLWRTVCESENSRPAVPWVAFRGMTDVSAAAVAWAWLEKRGLV
jgi:hypothetical protein